MPRNSNARGTECSANVATKVRNNAIKTEVEGPGEQHVFHRKSERRRVARDIFLVFEEQPSRRGRGSNKKKTAQKPKFGHLMVEDPHKTKSLLRDIKNEPKCYLTTECPVKEKKPPKPPIRNEIKPIEKVSTVSDDPVARVNPIFLWVKQDDTRIVEVRCEDYDKRNRIRLTKTTNGWRAIPRTDPSSSKFVKILQTPMMKVKREIYENNIAEKCNESFCSNKDVTEAIEKISFNNQNGIDHIEGLSQKIPEVISKEKLKKIKAKREKKRRKPVNKRSTEVCQEQVAEVTKELIADTNCVNDYATINEVVLEPTIPAVDNIYKELVSTNSEENVVELPEEADLLGVTDVAEIKEMVAEPPPQTLPELELNTEIEPEPQSEPEIAAAAEMEAETATEVNTEIETYQHHTPHLQLCPKTGLFLPNIGDENIDAFNTNFLSKNILVDLVDCDEVCDKSNNQESEPLGENLDADTKNLKDLLDDADLLQHCGDNANSGADIIDSIVKRSCENNLIQETETLKEAITPATFNSSNREEILQKNLMDQTIPIPHILDRVNDSPKCLSFNEAGEIEGINGELFQSNNFMDTYDKEPTEDIRLDGKKSDTPDLTTMPSPLLKNKLTEVVLEDSPKDLSYKKREEVCPPPESRSQCAVTSSSDIIKSPQQGEIPTIETTSEAIKNLILEQFLKLNALNTISSPVIKQQSEPINLGKHREATTGNDCSNYAPSTNYIETVVIDDNSDEEPVKKRVRNTVKHNNAVEENTTPILIDKDPDPLTQLQLLIRNTQWKVPDPILVPKDRLRAVLASPAREIPLLITTRPELRLPEAFAYPEIIQNPNILVISMAQLEAILKNEMEMEKNKPQCTTGDTPETPNENVNVKKPNPPCNNKVHVEPKHTKVKDVNPKCTHVETNLASDINAATLAVLNQMLWLPYFGQLSQEFLKSIKSPVGIQNKYSNLLPIYNHHIGLQHLDELYKNYLKQISALKHLNVEPTSNPLQSFPLPIGSFQSSMEATVFQKMLQHQMHNFLNINSLATDTSQRGVAEKSTANEVLPNGDHNHIITVEEKKSKKSTITIPEINRNGNELSEKSQRLNHLEMNCDNAMTENNDFNKYTCLQKQELENKPRLQCKSLSNLLEPESVTSPTVPLINLTTESIRSATHEPTNNQINSISKDTAAITTAELMPFKTGKLNKTTPAITTAHELSKQRKRNLNYTETNTAAEQTSRSTDNLNIETNQALWHPLFGSNAKTGYSSPWQWTTVTATGE